MGPARPFDEVPGGVDLIGPIDRQVYAVHIHGVLDGNPASLSQEPSLVRGGDAGDGETALAHALAQFLEDEDNRRARAKPNDGIGRDQIDCCCRRRFLEGVHPECS